MARLTLTFDNGPTPETTPQVLDVLGERGIRATFFVVGQRLEEPAALALAQRAKAEGHWLGNHTTSHDAPLGLCAEPGHAEPERFAHDGGLEGAITRGGNGYHVVHGGG